MLLDKYSNEELNAEIERRKQIKRKAPEPLENLVWQPLLNVCRDYLHELETLGFADDDYPHYIFEAAITAIYGADIWTYINSVKE